MTHLILFGVGSPVIVDVEESLHRANIHVAFGIRNFPGPSHLPEDIRVLVPEDLTDNLRRLPFMVPLFMPAHRRSAALEAARVGLRSPFSLIDPTVAIPRRFNCAPGTYVNVGCCLGSNCDFGPFVFVNRGASIGHHARLGAFVSIGPGAVLSGQVTIGASSVVGAGAVILPAVTIGANTVVGAGAVVTRDVPEYSLVIGNPARVLRRDVDKNPDRSVA